MNQCLHDVCEVGPHGVEPDHFDGEVEDRVDGLVQGPGEPRAQQLAVVGDDLDGLVDGGARVQQVEEGGEVHHQPKQKVDHPRARADQEAKQLCHHGQDQAQVALDKGQA